MRNIVRGMLVLSFCLLPLSRAWADTATLEIDITVSITSTLDFEWVVGGGTGIKGWNLAGSSLAATPNTIGTFGADGTYDIINKSSVPVSVAVAVTNQGTNWTNVQPYSGAANQYEIRICFTQLAADFANCTNPVAPTKGLILSSGTASAALLASLAGGNTKQHIDLQFHLPTTVTAGDNGIVKVVMTATSL